MKVNLKFFCTLLLGLFLMSPCSYAQQPEKERHFDDDFKERYTGDKFNYEGEEIITKREIPDGEYADYEEENITTEERDNQNSVSFNLGPFTWVFYLVVAAGVIYLIYILLNEGGSGLFSSRRQNKLNIHQPITAETIENTDLNSLIKKAENNKDYRLAIRYYYLLVLKTLSLKKIIQFEDDKTNAEYINELAQQPYSNDFKGTSYVYNYVWYGEFPLNAERYKTAKSKFITLLSQVK